MPQELAKIFATRARCRSFSLADAVEEAGETTVTERVLHAYIEHSSILARGYDRFNFLCAHGVLPDAKHYIWLRKDKKEGKLLLCSAKSLFAMVISCDEGAIFVSMFPTYHEDLLGMLGEKDNMEAEKEKWLAICKEKGGTFWPQPRSPSPSPELSYFS